MTTYLSVFPGIDMSKALGERRLTKRWLREYLAAHPEKDFHTRMGAAVNGEDCIRQDLSLEVRRRDDLDLVASVEFTRAPGTQWGYKAVIR